MACAPARHANGMTETSRSYPAGVAASEFAVGDFILSHRRGFASWCIRFGQRIATRFAGNQRAYTYWSHAALVVSEQGDLVEALTKGVSRSHIDAYKHIEYTLVRVHAEPLDQKQILRFANEIVGEKYGWSTIFCITVGSLTGNKFSFGFQGHAICSGLVARAEERMGAYFKRLAEDISPADLARYYSVAIPTTPKYKPS